jgi:hypothetical protein
MPIGCAFFYFASGHFGTDDAPHEWLRARLWRAAPTTAIRDAALCKDIGFAAPVPTQNGSQPMGGEQHNKISGRDESGPTEL